MATFKVGDRVRIAKKIPDMGHQGWAYWNSADMDSTVGKEGRVITALEPGYGYQVVMDTGGAWYFAPDALEPAQAETVEYPIAFKPLLDAVIAEASARRELKAQNEATQEARGRLFKAKQVLLSEQEKAAKL